MYYLYVTVVLLSEVRPTAVLLFPGNKKGLQQPEYLLPTASTDYQKSSIQPYRERVAQLAMDQAAGQSPG